MKTTKHLQNGDFGLHRNAIRKNAESLKNKGQNKEALIGFLEVAYYDLNGPRNYNPHADNFDTRRALLPPGVIFGIKELINALSLKEMEVHKLFINVAEPVYLQLEPPIEPKEAWYNGLKKELFNN